MKILVFAGTKSGRELISKLLDLGHNVISSSLSVYGTSLLTDNTNLIKLTGKMSWEDIESAISTYQVDLVIDSTHPYAKEISENIIKATSELKTKLFRFERERSIPDNLGLHFDSMESACKYLQKCDGNIFFTTGVNALPYITGELNIKRVFGRVLNVPSSIKIINECGFSSEQIIVKNPPYSKGENIDFIRSNNIKYLVTKDSGPDGNIDEKLQAVMATGVSLITIDRPILSYDNIYLSMEEILTKIL